LRLDIVVVRAVLDCNKLQIIVDSSMKLKFIPKISVIQKKFLAFFNLLREPDITHLWAGCRPRVVHPCSRVRFAYRNDVLWGTLCLKCMMCRRVHCADIMI